jgi:transcriptional regulator with XRE-family HTH domain
MHIISPSQCRAARALLNWSQPELAEKCDMHVQTISNFENDLGSPSKRTLQKITHTFFLNGILTTEDDGVKRTHNIIRIIEGPNCRKEFMDEVYNDLKDHPNSEVLIAGLEEAQPDDKEMRSFVEDHINRMQKAGIKERLLIKEGDLNLIAPKESYRWIPQKYFSKALFQVHGNKLALRELGVKTRIVIIENEFFADAFRNLFNFAWDHSKEPKVK